MIKIILSIAGIAILLRMLLKKNGKGVNRLSECALFPIGGKGDMMTRWYLGLAGPFSAKNFRHCNKFLHGNSTMWKAAMKRDWGIENKEELLEMIDDLLGDDMLYYDKLLPILKEKDRETICKYLLTCGYKKEISDTYADFIPKITENFEDTELFIPQETFKSWNFARAAFLMMAGEVIGYVSREEVLETFKKIGREAVKYYDSWDEYTASFLYGRKLWILNTGGYGEDAAAIDLDYTGIICFLRSSRSICNKIEFSDINILEKLI